jgi:hypothetical protein
MFAVSSPLALKASSCVRTYIFTWDMSLFADTL